MGVCSAKDAGDGDEDLHETPAPTSCWSGESQYCTTTGCSKRRVPDSRSKTLLAYCATCAHTQQKAKAEKEVQCAPPYIVLRIVMGSKLKISLRAAQDEAYTLEALLDKVNSVLEDFDGWEGGIATGMSSPWADGLEYCVSDQLSELDGFNERKAKDELNFYALNEDFPIESYAQHQWDSGVWRQTDNKTSPAKPKAKRRKDADDCGLCIESVQVLESAVPAQAE